MPVAGNSVLPQVAADNSDILVWLDVLLKGKPEQQALARTEIAMILEARGHTDDAEEAYWTNVQARAADRRAYERLIAIYEQKGDRLSASLVRRQLDEVFNGPASAPASGSAGPASTGPAPTGPASVGPGQAAARPGTARAAGQRARRPHPGAHPGEPGQAALPNQAPTVPPAAPAPPPLPTPPVVTATGPGAAAGHAYAAIVHAANLQAAAQQQAAAQPSAAGAAPSAARQAAQPARPAGAPSSQPARPQPVQVQPQPAQVQPLPTLPLPAAPAYDAALPVRRWPSPLSPHPEVVQPRRSFNPSGLVALQPSTIGAFLLASVGAAAIIVFLLIVAERGFGSGANASAQGAQTASASTASQLPPRCTDAALRFPSLNLSDPRASVVAGYRANGIDVDRSRPGGAQLSTTQAEQVLGGWMAISLLMERSGQPAPSLTDWLNADDSRPTLANALAAGRRVDAMITRDEWATMRGWPATTCEGAFLHEPRNATAVSLMERVVAR